MIEGVEGPGPCELMGLAPKFWTARGAFGGPKIVLSYSRHPCDKHNRHFGDSL